MSTVIILLIVALALLGAPLFAIFAGAAMMLFATLENTSITGAAADIFSEKFAESPLLVTIPLFTFAGYLMAESGTPRRLVRVSRAWFGWLPGGLAIVCLLASAFFTTFTGGSGITIVAIGGLLYPALIAEKYPEKFSLGLITSGGSLGLLFPPSLPIVLFAVVAGLEVEKLFAAGILPGIVTLIALGLYAAYIGVKTPNIPRQPFERKEAFAALREVIWELLLPVVLIGALALGVLRIHEAAAFTALYVFVIEVFVYRDVSFKKDLPRIVEESMTLVGAILAILATAIGFTGFLIQDQLPMKILAAMSEYISGPIMFLLVLNVFLLVVGMLMDIFSAIVVVVPLILPIAREFGMTAENGGLYYLGIVFLLNLEIGYMTPPVGLNLFISSFRFDKPVTTLYRAVIPFIGLLIVALLITTYVPKLALSIVPLDENETEFTLFGEPEGDDDEPIPDEDGELDLDALEGDEPLDLDALEDEIDGELDLDALEDELDAEDDLDGELDLDALEDELDAEDAAEDDELDLDSLEGGDAEAAP
ncbi:MAG: TRAP transporter large permease subunit [Myxococcota bacterium]